MIRHHWSGDAKMTMIKNGDKERKTYMERSENKINIEEEESVNKPTCKIVLTTTNEVRKP